MWWARTHLEDQLGWPCSRKVVCTEVFEAERVFFGDLVALQLARLAWSAAHMVKLEYSTEDLAHNLRRQLDPERPGNSIPGQVAILGLPIDVDGVRVREHMGLGYLPFNANDHEENFKLTSWLAFARSTNIRCPLKSARLPTVWSTNDSPGCTHKNSVQNERT